MRKKIDLEWVKKNAKYWGFDGYGFSIYKYGNLYITIDENNGEQNTEVLAVEYVEEEK